MRRQGDRNQVVDSPDIRVERSERGVALFLNRPGGGSSARVRQYLLTDASKPDYFVCRALSVAIDPEDPAPIYTIGAAPVYVAKPYNLRRSPFDGSSVEISVESWNGSILSTATHTLTFDYKSATFRIVTDETESVEENQTIIPRFVPAVLVEEEDEPVTTETIAPTIIYAVECTGLGIVRPDNPELPEEEQTDVPVTLLAENDGWAWMQTE